MKIQSIIKDCPAELKENEKKIRTKRARMIKAARREQRESLDDVNEALRNYRGIDFRREEEEEKELQSAILEMENQPEKYVEEQEEIVDATKEFMGIEKEIEEMNNKDDERASAFAELFGI